MKEKLIWSLLACTLLGATATLNKPHTASRIVLGTHAPSEMTRVWQFLKKDGGRASACPVKVDGTTVIFLTAGHNVRDLKGASILQDRTKQRKLKVTKHLKHPTVDLGILWAESDGKDVELFTPNTEEKLDVGLSVFAVGYPFPSYPLLPTRGYLSGTPGWMSAPVFAGMSGGALLTNDGLLMGIVHGYGQGSYGTTRVFDNTPAHKTIGHSHDVHNYHGQGSFVPLAPYSQWLKANKILD